MKAVWQVYPALIQALEHEASSRTGGDQARGILEKVRNIQFLLTTPMFMDVMPILDKLSKCFQADNLDVSLVSSMVSSCMSSIQQMKSDDGMMTLASTCEEVGPYRSGERTEFKGCALVDRANLRSAFKTNLGIYLDQVITKLKSRFEELRWWKIWIFF